MRDKWMRSKRSSVRTCSSYNLKEKKTMLMLLFLMRSGKVIRPIPVRLKIIGCLHRRSKILLKVTCLDRTFKEYTVTHLPPGELFFSSFGTFLCNPSRVFLYVEVWIYQPFCHIQHPWSLHSDACYSMFQPRAWLITELFILPEAYCKSSCPTHPSAYCIKADCHFCTIQDIFWFAYIRTKLNMALPEED